MTKALYCTQIKHRTLYAEYTDELCTNFWLDTEGQSQVGKIYFAKVSKVLKGKGVFVEYGENTGFLSTQYTGSYPEGLKLIVQVLRDKTHGKNPLVTDKFSLSRRYLVLKHSLDEPEVSRKIQDEGLRQHLMNQAYDLKTDSLDYHFIVRTNGSNTEDWTHDIDDLIQDYKEIISSKESQTPGALLYDSNSFVEQLIFDAPFNYDAIYAPSELLDPIVDSVSKYLGQNFDLECVREESQSSFHPPWSELLTESLLSKFHTQDGIELIVQYFEAMVFIDVNSSRERMSHSPRMNNLNINKKAAIAIARQLRLSDIGGTILVDFIDIRSKEERQELYHFLTKELQKDIQKAQLRDLTRNCVAIIQRQKAKPSLHELFHEPCPACSGLGYVQAEELICLKIVLEIEEKAKTSDTLTVRAHVNILELLQAEFSDILQRNIQLEPFDGPVDEYVVA